LSSGLYPLETVKQMHHICNRVIQGVEIDSITRRVNLYASHASRRLDGRILRPIEEMHRRGGQAGILSVGYGYGIARILSAGGYGEVFDFIEANGLQTNGSRVSEVSFRTGKSSWLTELLSRLSVPPDKAIYIGDARPDEPCFEIVGYPVVSFLATDDFKQHCARKFGAQCVPESEADLQREGVSYVAVAPGTMRVGENVAVTFTLLDGEGRLAGDNVRVALLKGNREVVTAESHINGKGKVEISIPSDLAEGDYQLRISGTGFEDRTSVRVEKSLLVFLETDKPIYKPGQTIHIRVITLNSDLRPLSETVTVEALDAKGIKIFRRTVETDEYGMATLDLPLSTEPNLGVWKINGLVADERAQLDVRVERYVLPKYEIRANLPREWFMVNEPIRGSVTAEYSFGKAVRGELKITASRYVGEWEEYATFTKQIDGETHFEIPPVRYVAGVPGARGMGNIILDITVTERATGYQEKISKLLTVSETSLSIQIIPEGTVFKPWLPFSFLIVTETPDNKPSEAAVAVTITYLNEQFREVKTEQMTIITQNGKGIVSVTPPNQSTTLQIHASAEGARASRSLVAGYSPSGSFIHVEQVSEGIPQVGQQIVFRVHSTRETASFYYEVISRGKVVFTDFTRSNEIAFVVTPQMAPSARLLVYQILPNGEVAADFIPFKVQADYPHKVTVNFSQEEARPGDEIGIEVNTEGESRVGIVAVDRSVFILAENRLNLQQVFDELERLYMRPQVELHEVHFHSGIVTRGARDVFVDTGVVVLSNKTVPEGREHESPWRLKVMAEGAPVPVAAPLVDAGEAGVGGGLAEVERVRQFFPETWLWQDILTDSDGRGFLNVEVPDSITTWMLRAVAISKENGFGIGEAQLKAFQPFFFKIDLPYSSIRGEEFPVKVAIYNYLDEAQNVQVEIEKGEWFDLLDQPVKWVDIAANDIGGVEFMISPRKLGINDIKITARSRQAADAMIKTVIVEPEGVSREIVENLTLSGGTSRIVDTGIPPFVIEDSGRVYLAITSSFLTQTIEGLEGLLRMPFGCGEQNMILFAPNVYITKYLRESGQLKPEIMAKAEKLMITGYQRQLTYRRGDGSFSAFGESDKEGSLFLTAFVLRCFSQAKGLIYIDDNILREATDWITAHQKADGSFESVGFVHHQEIMGGLSGKTALTAYVAIGLMEAGESIASGRAVLYLEKQLGDIVDPYVMAITAYALALAGSELKDEAYEKLMAFAEEDEDGLHWGGRHAIISPGEAGRSPAMPQPGMPQSAAIEATAYATLALIEHRDAFNASRAARWLVSQRNAYGGYGSTQDTVVALQALTEYSSGLQADVDLRVTIAAGGEKKELLINRDNFDVLQVVEVPVNEQVTINVSGKGEAIAQVVKRFNLPDATAGEEQILTINVDYDTTAVEVNDLIEVSVEIEFNPPVPMEAGMVVLDISIPTGFAPVVDSVAGVVERQETIKRYEVAGRKVIFYIENMLAGERISFSFDVQVMYPVRAKGVT
ncbi:MG2 domain-containing protein, partial [Dehalococcoidia bacterium]|nr:MG2 domain-containing protein [Dehalococcoidia bacterium]